MKAGEFAGSCQYPILDSLVVRIPACHAGGRGSIPRQGEMFLFNHDNILEKKMW